MRKGKSGAAVKLIYLLFLLGTGVLVSFRGGNISYLLFYLALALPICALAYSLYVYLRFKIVQDVSRTVVKGDEVPYRLIMANENGIPFTSIALNFMTEMVNMEESGTDRLCLPGRSHLLVDTRMYCKYRGTYPVGVKSVEVTDFLGLFTITYPMKSQVRLTARPRLIPLEKLRVKLQEKDPKSALFSATKFQNLPDFELRGYQQGDPLRYIHWKNSARAGELLVRKLMPEEMFEIVLIMDLCPVEGDRERRLRTEDRIVEASLSFVHEYYKKRIPVRVVYMQSETEEQVVDGRSGFDGFYGKCADIAFTSAAPIEEVWAGYLRLGRTGLAFILVTAFASDALRAAVEENRAQGREVLLVDAGELEF